MLTRAQIAQRTAQLAQLRSAAQARVDETLEASTGEGRARTPEESELIAAARAEVAQIDAEVTELRRTDEELRLAEEAAASTAPAPVADDETRAAAGAAQQRATVRVGREPRTYERHDSNTSYLLDFARVQLNQGMGIEESRQRLERHAAECRVDLPRIEARIAATRGGYQTEVRGEGEDRSAEVRYRQEQRDLDRTDGSGGYFVPPLWLMEDYIAVSRASRVTADLCNVMPLPANTDSINIPKVATGATVAIQTADNAAVSETDITDTSIQANVKTIAGQQDLAMQLLDQSPVSFDQITFADLTEDHAVKTDVQVLSGSNASNQVRGIEQIPSVDTTSYTDASPTVAELYPKLADSANQVATDRKRPVQAIIMHPRRWYWMLASLDSSDRPLVVMDAQGPQNALASIDMTPAAEGRVGMLPFGPVFIDPNIPITNGGGTEDIIILTRPTELYLWESAIRTRILQEVLSGTLSVRLQVFNYLAFMPHRRAENTSIVSGTGLAAPSF